MYVCVLLFVCLPGRVLITRCWYGNLSLVSSSASPPWLGWPGRRAGPRGPGVLSPWRRPTVTFHLCSARPSVSLSAYLRLGRTVSVWLCLCVFSCWPLLILLTTTAVLLLLLLLLALLRQYHADRIVTLFCRCLYCHGLTVTPHTALLHHRLLKLRHVILSV